MSNDFAGKAKRIVDVLDEMRLIQTILHYARSGHATDVMVEQAIALVDRHIEIVKADGDASLLKAATDLKASLEKALADGVKSLRAPRGPGEEAIKVEAPLARQRLAAGHQIELIEWKVRGTSAALGEAAGQLKRYARSFPGSRLTIAVVAIEDEAAWLADVLRREGIGILETGDGSG